MGYKKFIAILLVTGLLSFSVFYSGRRVLYFVSKEENHRLEADYSRFWLFKETFYTLLHGTKSVFSFINPVYAAFNPEINYQGKLTDSNGVAVADGTYQMVFKLYTVSSGGTAVWTETRSGVEEVTTEGGLFSIMLGEVESLSGVNFNQDLWLGVTIESDSEMTPRKKIGSVPSAFEAASLGGATSTQYLRSDEADQMNVNSTDTALTINQSGAGDILNIQDGGSNVLTVADGGNVTISANLLPVSNGSGSLGSASAGFREFYVGGGGGGKGLNIYGAYIVGGYGWTHMKGENGRLSLGTGTNVNYTGLNKGASFLHFNNGTENSAAVGASNGDAILETFSGDVLLRGGNVGVGTDTPSTALDVNGVITATGGNSTNWNTAYGWGDHATEGYLTSYTETDPVFTAWDKSTGISITESQISDFGSYVPYTGATADVQLGDNLLTITPTFTNTPDEIKPVISFKGTSGELGDGQAIDWSWGSTLTARITTEAVGSTEDDLVFYLGGGTPTERLRIQSTGELQIAGLTANSSVYTDSSKNLTTTAPTSGTIGYWSRTGTTISPATSGDNITTTGTITANTFSGSGASLTSLNATNLATGTVPLARLSNLTTSEFASANISQWTNDSGYITSADDTVSGTELDGVFSTTGILRRTSSGTYSTITDNSTDWNTAFGWGDHSAEGYLVNSNNLSDITSSSTARTNLGLGSLATLSNLSTFDTDDLSEGTTNLYSQWDTATGGINYAGGNVGIGTNSPSYQLEVQGTGASTDGILISTSAFTSVPNPGSVSGKVILNPRGFNFSSDSTTLSSIYQPSLGVGIAVNRTAPAFSLKNGATYPAMLVEQGRIGVYTNSPQTPIDVRGTIRAGSDQNTSFETRIDLKGNQYQEGGSNVASGGIEVNGVKSGVGYGVIGSMFFYAGDDTSTNTGWAWNADTGLTEGTNLAGSGAQMVINKSGNVGIGTTTPSEKLSVVGNGLFSGTLSASNLSGTNTGDQDLSGYLATTTAASTYVLYTGATTAVNLGSQNLTTTGNITGGNLNISNWNTAYGWGDHSTEGYLTSYTETDPVFTAWDKSTGISITESQISDFGSYVPYTGATADVQLGDNLLTITPTFTNTPDEIKPVISFKGTSGELGDGQAIDWSWGSTLTARITTEAVGSTEDDLVFYLGGGTPTERLRIQSTGELQIAGLTANSSVYTDSSKNLTTTAPTSGTIGYWSRTGTTISPATSGDNITTTGSVGIGTSTPTETLTVSGSTLYPVKITASDGLGFILGSRGSGYSGFWSSAVGTPTTGNYALIANGSNTVLNAALGSGYVGLATGGSVKLYLQGSTGNVGIGTTTPSTALDVNGVITATGGNSTNWNTAYGWGDHSAEGYLTSTSINSLNPIEVGTSNSANAGSTALGFNNTSSGTFSSAIGTFNDALGDYSTGSGYLNTASGDYSSAFGYVNTASGNYSSTFGSFNTASTLNSQVFGRSNFTGTGNASVVMGILNNQTGGSINTSTGVITGTPVAANAGNISTAVGIYNTASGDYSSALGFYNTASGYNSFASGIYNNSSGANSSASGYYNIASATSSSAFGSNINNSVANSVEIGPANTEKLRISSAGINFITAGSNGFQVNGVDILAPYLATTTAASTYVPYTGATTAVNLGSQNLTTTGNVGIGTTTPVNTLDVYGNAFVSDYIEVNDGNEAIYMGPIPSTVNYAGLWLRNSQSTATAANYTFLGNGTSSFFNATSGGDINFRINNSTKMQVDGATGYVGIGNTSPTQPLDVTGNARINTGYLNVVSGSSSSFLGIGSLISGGGADDTALRANGGALIFSSGGNTERARFDSSGNFGIGTTTPAEKLDVVGNILTKTSSGTPLVKLTSITAGTPAYEGGRLEIYGDNNTANPFAFYVAEDISNAATRANYIVPTGNSTRLHLGTSSLQFYSMNLNYVQRFENFPSTVTMKSETTSVGGELSSIVSASASGGSRLVLYPGNYTGWLSGSAQGGIASSGGMRNVAWNSYVHDSDNYSLTKGSAYIYGTYNTSTNWSNPHTTWTIGQTSSTEGTAIGRLSMEGGWKAYTQSADEVIYYGKQMVGSFTGNAIQIDNSSDTNLFLVKADGGGYFAGNVGIGTTTPAFDLDVLGDINFTGTLYEDGVAYAPSVNTLSPIVVGNSNTAAGIQASAFGYGNSSSANYSLTLGHSNTASDPYTTVIGYGNTSSTENSVVIGRSNFAYIGDAIVNIGILNNQTGGSIDGFGQITGTPAQVTSGDFSTIIGVLNTSSGARGVAIGYNNTASSNDSLAIGNQNTAIGTGSQVFGYLNDMVDDGGVFARNFIFGYNNDITISGAGTNFYDSTIVGNANSFTISSGTTIDRVTVLGYSNEATGDQSTAVGYNNTVSASDSSAFGSNVNNSTANSLEIGPSNTAKLQLTSTYVRPATDNSQALGGSSNRWTEVYATNGTINTSDERLKTNITELDYGLEQIMALRPVEYDWKDGSNGEIKQLGLIAQEVIEVMPEVVNVGDDENQTLGIKYSTIIPTLISAIQEMNLYMSAFVQDTATGIVGMFKRVETEELCVGDVCVTEAEFARVFGTTDTVTSSSNTNSNTDSSTNNDTSIVDTDTTTETASTTESTTEEPVDETTTEEPNEITTEEPVDETTTEEPNEITTEEPVDETTTEISPEETPSEI